jgi:HD-like signal output (HDOD) protein
MSIKLLRVANSAFFSLPRKVATLEHAIVLLGTNYIQALALSLSVVDVLAYSQDVGHISWEEYWLHSFACGCVCNRMVQRGLFADVGDDAFLCGLLHDIGKPILWVCEGHAYQAVKKQTQSEGLMVRDAERIILGTDHAEVGGHVISRWSFPQSIVDATQAHHDLQSTKPAACLVQAADWVVYNAWFTDGLNRTSSAYPMNPVPVRNVDTRILTEVGKELLGRNNEIQALVKLLSS